MSSLSLILLFKKIITYNILMFSNSNKTEHGNRRLSITSLTSLPYELSAVKLKNTIYLGFSSIKYQLSGKLTIKNALSKWSI